MNYQNPWNKRNAYRFKEDLVAGDPSDGLIRDMHRSITELCNPWYVQSATTIGIYALGLANPFKNNLPLVPWL